MRIIDNYLLFARYIADLATNSDDKLYQIFFPWGHEIFSLRIETKGN